MRFYSLFLLLALFAAEAWSAEGNGGSNGGDPKVIDENSIRLLLEGDGLKNAMLNYLKTLPVDEVADPEVKKTLLNANSGGALERDIRTSDNYIVKESCEDKSGNQVPAATQLGNKGGKICFDAKRLVGQYKELSHEEMMIRLASLAFHEHIHHFQSDKDSDLQNEKQANQVAAYVQLTAKIVQVPLLKWFDPKSGKAATRQALDVDQCRQFKELAEQRFESEIVGADSSAAIGFGLTHEKFYKDQDRIGNMFYELIRPHQEEIYAFLNADRLDTRIRGGGRSDAEWDFYRKLYEWTKPVRETLKKEGSYLQDGYGPDATRKNYYYLRPFVRIENQKIQFGVCTFYSANAEMKNRTYYEGCQKQDIQLAWYSGSKLDWKRYVPDDGGSYSALQVQGQRHFNMWTDFHKDEWVMQQIGYNCERLLHAKEIKKREKQVQETDEEKEKRLNSDTN
jgi:hypothetical protein